MKYSGETFWTFKHITVLSGLKINKTLLQVDWRFKFKCGM